MQPSVLSSALLATHQRESKFREFLKGVLVVSPLCIAILPWGILAGSYALNSGLSFLQSQMLSALVFAGSAQLVVIGLMHAGAGLFTILLTTAFIASRHFLYALALRTFISPLPRRWRMVLGFLLTDELFAACAGERLAAFNRWYALGAGSWLYLCWNIATLAGIVAGKFIPNLESLGLDFAIAATFIAIVIPSIQNIATLISVLVAMMLSTVLAVLNISGALMIASLSAMMAGFFCEKLLANRPLYGANR